MTPDDLDLRLRRALDEMSSAWQPKEGSAPELVSAVSRRRARRHRSAMTIGCAVIAALVLTVGVGVYATTSKTDNRASSGGSVQPPTSSAGSGSTAGPGLSKRALPSQQQANGGLACASVTLNSGVSQCGGGYFSTSSASPGFSAAHSVAGTASATSAPAILTVEVGQRFTVRLPAPALGSWRGPVVIAASRLPATLRQGLPASQSTAPAGAVRVVGRVRVGTKRVVTAVFEATKPGDVVLTATLIRACGHTSNRQAKPATPSCTGASTQWLTLLVVVPR